MFRFFSQPILKKLTAAFAVGALVLPLCATLLMGGTPTALAAAQPGAVGTAQAPGGISLPQSITDMVGSAILTITAFFPWVGGMTLDWALDGVVIGMGNIMRQASVEQLINGLWTYIRDISLLVFIFAFIYIGILTIIDYESNQTKQWLYRIIVGAFLINFSLFFAKFIIDISNFLAFQIRYTLGGNVTDGSISASFAQAVQILNIYSTTPTSLANMTLAQYIMFGLFQIILGLVLFAGALLILVRFAILFIIMIFSPLLFATWVFPQTQDTSKKLWGVLINYALFAPAYLFLLLVSLRVVQGLSVVINPTQAGLRQAVENTAIGGGGPLFGALLIFFVATILLIQSLTISRKLGIAGSSSIINYTKLAGGAATAGLTARLGRATLGRMANNMANDETLKDKAATSFFRKQQLKMARSVADSNFDARSVKGVGGKLGIGEGRKGGYKTVQEEITKKEQDFAKSLGTVDDSDVRVQARKREYEAAQLKAKAEIQALRLRQRDFKDKPEDDDAKRAQNARERMVLQEQISKLEKGENEAKVNYEKEKQRRVIGSTFAVEEDPEVRDKVKAVKDSIDTEKAALEKLWKGDPDAGTWAYTDSGLSPDEKKFRRSEIQKQMDKIEELKKKAKNHESSVSDRGYAGVFEKTKWWKSWPVGRMVAQEREAGEEIRKAAEKGLPKEKD
jgi:hypothetical protein